MILLAAIEMSLAVEPGIRHVKSCGGTTISRGNLSLMKDLSDMRGRMSRKLGVRNCAGIENFIGNASATVLGIRQVQVVE